MTVSGTVSGEVAIDIDQALRRAREEASQHLSEGALYEIRFPLPVGTSYRPVLQWIAMVTERLHPAIGDIDLSTGTIVLDRGRVGS